MFDMKALYIAATLALFGSSAAYAGTILDTAIGGGDARLKVEDCGNDTCGTITFGKQKFVVKKSDINSDCKSDGIDLNALARSWNSATSDPGYDSAVDFDGDGYVGPVDLTIFVTQFGKPQPGCP